MVVYERASRNPSMKVGFYVGCLINYAYTDIADAVIEVLNQFGVEAIVFPKAVVLWHLRSVVEGCQDGAKTGKYKAKAIRKSGVEVVTTGCPGCHFQIEDLLDATGSAVKCTHTIQVLWNALVSTTK